MCASDMTPRYAGRPSVALAPDQFDAGQRPFVLKFPADLALDHHNIARCVGADEVGGAFLLDALRNFRLSRKHGTIQELPVKHRSSRPL